MINWTTLLHQVIDLELDVDEAQELEVGPEARKQTIFTALDVELAKLADGDGWFNILEHNENNSESIEQHYLKAIELFLLFSAKQQWTHLIVMDDKQWGLIKRSKPATKLAEQNKQYLAIKHFLGDAYYNHRQESFRHAWHLLIKWGLIDLGFTDEKITTKYKNLIKTQRSKWGH
ncbi:MAG: hypothetical protein LKJ51_06230 [Limosilactobacillus sp.]|jgi:hypothetical protein|uniref:hypothetical protein n=1 Tax=Limosilactobacillus sp. TaxID=2773925 RepID=UPI0025BFA312|nr:hypothetical protein [Limosilactobacillus sp.]MCI1975500.1 hypothetical protein [Limosilactobacillus sp.]